MTIRKQGDAWVVRRNITRRWPSKKAAIAYDLILESALAEAERRHDNDERPCRIRDRLNEFLADSAAGLRRKPCNAETVALNKKRLLAFDAVFHSKPLDAITRTRVEQWMKRRLRGEGGKRLGAGTVNSELATLKAFAKWAQQKGYAPPALPLLTVGRLRIKGLVPGFNSKPPKALEMGELMDIIARIEKEREDVALVLKGMACFCLRPGAVCALRRRDVVLPKGDAPGRLESQALKRHFDRSLPIFPGSVQHAWVLQCLDFARRLRCRSRSGKPLSLAPDEPLVLCRSGRCVKNPGGWTTQAMDGVVAAICGKLGIDFIPYQIRHSTVSWLQRQPDISPAGVQAAAGHSRIGTQDIYGKRRGSEAIPAFQALSYRLQQYGATENPEGRRGDVSGV